MTRDVTQPATICATCGKCVSGYSPVGGLVFIAASPCRACAERIARTRTETITIREEPPHAKRFPGSDCRPRMTCSPCAARRYVTPAVELGCNGETLYCRACSAERVRCRDCDRPTSEELPRDPRDAARWTSEDKREDRGDGEVSDMGHIGGFV